MSGHTATPGPTEAQQVRALQVELFMETEGPQGDAWIADEAGTDSLKEFFQFVDGHLAANIDATKAIKAFLRKHSKLRRKALATLTARKVG